MNTDKLIARARYFAELRARASEGWELNLTGHPHMDRVQILRSKCKGYIEAKSANVVERQYNLRLAFAAPEMVELLNQMADIIEAQQETIDDLAAVINRDHREERHLE